MNRNPGGPIRTVYGVDAARWMWETVLGQILSRTDGGLSAYGGFEDTLTGPGAAGVRARKGDAGMSDIRERICIEVPEVVGVGECQVVIVSNLVLSAAATEIKRVTKTVRVDDYTIANGSVLIDGTVVKNVEYERTDNLIGSNLFNVAFDCCISVPGARTGDRFQVESAQVCAERDEIVGAPSTNLFEKLCVHVVGKVTRQVQITVSPERPNHCPEIPTACDEDPRH